MEENHTTMIAAQAARQRQVKEYAELRIRLDKLPRIDPKCPHCKAPTKQNLKPGSTRVRRTCKNCGYLFMLEADTKCQRYVAYRADCLNHNKNKHNTNLLLKHDSNGFYRRCQACGFEETERSPTHFRRDAVDED